MTNVTSRAKTLATTLLRRRHLQRLAIALAAVRHRSLILVYHRLSPNGPASHQVVRSLPVTVFAQQLEALAKIGQIVPIDTILQPGCAPSRVQFAITFDDDDVTHVDHALPALQKAGITATFFLSGRALHKLAPYWWEVLEQSLLTRGLDRTTELLQRAGLEIHGEGISALASGLEGSPLAERLHLVLPTDGHTTKLEISGMQALAAAGMTIGFHTLHHPVLTMLDDARLAAALGEGRSDLSSVIGSPVTLLAYPYGRADLRVAGAAMEAGYRAAFVSGGRPVGPRRHPFLLGRWDPGTLTGDDLIAAATARLHRRARKR